MENLSIPNNWDEVFVDQYVELVKIDPDLMIYDRNMEILTILTDTEYTDEVWEDMDVDDLNDIMLKLKWITNSPSIYYNREIGKYRCIDINKDLSFGNYIDCDYFYNEKGISSLPYLCSILYRKFTINEWSNIVYEPYGKYDLDERSIFFNELNINDVYGLYKLFSDHKQFIHDTYSSLFEPIIIDLDEEEVDKVIDPEEQKEIEEEEKHSKWGWENVLYKLSGGDITKYDEILDMPFIFILNQLSYLKETGR